MGIPINQPLDFERCSINRHGSSFFIGHSSSNTWVGCIIIWAVKMVPGRLEELWGVRMCTVFVSFNFLGVQLSDFYGYNGRHFDPQKLGYGKKV